VKAHKWRMQVLCQNRFEVYEKIPCGAQSHYGPQSAACSARREGTR
jgi:hypothetical protein